MLDAPPGLFCCLEFFSAIDESYCLCYNENMSRHTPKETLPYSADYLDNEGDIRHPDDNPEGFAAEGFTPKGNDFTPEDAIDYLDFADEERANADEPKGVAVDLAFRATNLLLATDSYAKASMLRGFIRSNNRKKIHEYGGEEMIRLAIKRNTDRGRQALRAGTGIDAMLANPGMVPDEGGFPYTTQDAEDDLVQIQRHFRDELTADGARSLQDATAIEKIHKVKEIDQKREAFRRTLARYVINNKNTQS